MKKEEYYLSSAQELLNWLSEGEFIIEKNLLLNKLQIKRRIGELTEKDVDLLEKMKQEETNPQYLCGIEILLENKDNFTENFNKLTSEEQEEFKKYPIFSLIERL